MSALGDDALPLGGHAQGGAEAGPAPAAREHGADDARARLPGQGLHRPPALARERAADLHPRGRRSASGWARTSPRSSTSTPARCCTFPPGCRTRPRRSRTRSTSTSSARRGRTGSTARTPTCGTSEPRARRQGRARLRGEPRPRAGDRGRSWRRRARRWRSAPATRSGWGPPPPSSAGRLAVPADLAVAGEPTRVVEATLERFGRLDVLVDEHRRPAGRDARHAHARGLGRGDRASPQEHGRARRALRSRA